MNVHALPRPAIESDAANDLECAISDTCDMAEALVELLESTFNNPSSDDGTYRSFTLNRAEINARMAIAYEVLRRTKACEDAFMENRAQLRAS